MICYADRILSKSLIGGHRFLLPSVYEWVDVKDINSSWWLQYPRMSIEFEDSGYQYVFSYEQLAENDSARCVAYLFTANGNCAPVCTFTMSQVPDEGYQLLMDGKYIDVPGEKLKLVADIGMQAFCQLSQMAECKNVVITEAAKSWDRNPRKVKVRGDSYHVVKLPSPPKGGKRGRSQACARRLHWVRGHVRHLRSGKATWVTAHLKGSVVVGTIQKHYEAA